MQLDLTEDHVARATRLVADEAPRSDFTLCSDADFDRITARILSRRPQGPLRIFAYGSLIWNPTFEATGRQKVTAHGWHREFSMRMRSFRGTPEQPGLMMTMMSGGQCRGIAFDIEEARAEETVIGLVRRELPFVETGNDYRWIRVKTDDGPAPALVFWAGPTGDGIYRNLAPQTTAHMIARACGYRGSNAEYLRNTVISLMENGIDDRHLWQLQKLVATEIDRLFPALSTKKAAPCGTALPG